jgi:hypothetical protein
MRLRLHKLVQHRNVPRALKIFRYSKLVFGIMFLVFIGIDSFFPDFFK